MASATGRERISVPLPAPAAQEVARRAARCGLAVSTWCLQAIEAALADARCSHGRGAADGARGPAAGGDDHAPAGRLTLDWTPKQSRLIIRPW
jgi:hypothetical protein